MFGRTIMGLAVAGTVTLGGCVSPGLESRLRAIEQRQDSILTLLRQQREKNDFVASRLGWRPPPDTSKQDIPIGRSFTRGPANAALTIVEFSDLQCPYCAQLAPTLDSISKVYPNDVRLIFKNFPLSFHPQAKSAAAAAYAAGKQGKFFEFRFMATPHFRNLGDSLYLALAHNLNLDMDRFKRDQELPEISAILQEDIALGRKVGVEGTPTVFVNGKLATDRSFDYFAGLISEAKSNR
jgi:protein-disulfide isomerase